MNNLVTNSYVRFESFPGKSASTTVSKTGDIYRMAQQDVFNRLTSSGFHPVRSRLGKTDFDNETLREEPIWKDLIRTHKG